MTIIYYSKAICQCKNEILKSLSRKKGSKEYDQVFGKNLSKKKKKRLKYSVSSDPRRFFIWKI